MSHDDLDIWRGGSGDTLAMMELRARPSEIPVAISIGVVRPALASTTFPSGRVTLIASEPGVSCPRTQTLQKGANTLASFLEVALQRRLKNGKSVLHKLWLNKCSRRCHLWDVSLCHCRSSTESEVAGCCLFARILKARLVTWCLELVFVVALVADRRSPPRIAKSKEISDFKLYTPQSTVVRFLRIARTCSWLKSPRCPGQTNTPCGDAR